VSSGGTVTVESVVFTGGALSSVASITDGTASWSSNSLASFTSISGTTLTDGTFSVSSGAITGVTTLAAGTSVTAPLYDVSGAAGITFGSADVTAFTFSGQSEDLVLTPSSDVWTISSATGVTEINTTLQFATTGDILGAINISAKSANYTVGTDDAHESYGTLFINSDDDAQTWTLPSAVGGMNACFQNGQGVTAAMTLTPADGDYLVLDGARGTVATAIASTGAADDKICVVAADATDWYVMSYTGSWSE